MRLTSNPLSIFRNRYVLFITTVMLTIVLNQVIIQYGLHEQNEDARLINVAGRQRMLSQRIIKRVLYTRDRLKDTGQTPPQDLDTLKELIHQFKSVHFNLLKGDHGSGRTDRNSPAIKALLQANTPALIATVNACEALIRQPDLTTAQRAVTIITQHELNFLRTMEKTVATYQREAEEKLRHIKNIEIALAAFAILVLALEIFFIFNPMIKGLNNSNETLSKINEELITANAALQRTQAELLNNESALRDAKIKAEESNQAKSHFLSMMSHEIRTPMNAIIGLTHMLIQESPRPDQVESLKLLKFSSENLLTIINDILDLSKIEAGKIALEHISLDLFELAQNTQQMLSGRAREKQIDLHLNIDEKVPHIIKGDPVRIGQVLTNLVGNAIKFTEKGSVALSITAAGKEEDKHKIRFAVKDTGIGIEPEKMHIIFESFAQGNATTTRKFGGTGLGLSITKQLLKLMGSDIIVNSSLGHGAEFSFVLPVEEGNAEDIRKEINNDLSAALKDSAAKVLLVEDNPVNQIVAANFLRKWGLQVDFANHGKEALALIQSKAYAAVLMDLQMPEMDGYETTRKIRAMEESYFKEVPILALTASALIDIKRKVIETGMNDFITKPFQPDELQAKLGEYILTTPPAITPSTHVKAPINLDLYTEGDPEFKRELALLLIKNIEELKTALSAALKNRDAEIYRAACHKAKPTITMVGDTEFLQHMEVLKKQLLEGPAVNTALEAEITQFYHLSEQTIQSLREVISSPD